MTELPQPQPEEIRVKSFPDFIKQVGQVLGSLQTEGHSRSPSLTRAYWRGQLAVRKLVPFAFRCEGDREFKSRRETEQLLDFQHIAPARQTGCPGKDEHLDWLALAQHNGLPTRLLDWSESPLVAAFFAIERENGNSDSADSAVWALNPKKMNSIISVEDGLFPVASDDVQLAAHAAFNKSKPHLDGKVLAIVPCHFFPQQVGQQSCFTIHGNDTPLETYPEAASFLKRLVIPANIKLEMRQHLTELSIRRHHLFLDLPNLAREVRERYNEAEN